MLKRRLENLLTYMRYPITNAAAEGFNSKIQSIKSAARGFRAAMGMQVRLVAAGVKLPQQREQDAAEVLA